MNYNTLHTYHLKYLKYFYKKLIFIILLYLYVNMLYSLRVSNSIYSNYFL